MECRLSHYESQQDPPCDTVTFHPVKEEWGHWCKYGYTEVRPEHQHVLDCWRFLRVFGVEAGMQILLARYTRDELAAMADDLLLVMGVTNRVENEKNKPRGDGG